MSLGFCALLAALAFGGCGSDDTGGGQSEGPMVHCRSLISRYCNHHADCLIAENLADDRQLEFNECYLLIDKDIKCDQAKAIAPEYGACMDAIPNISCGEIAVADKNGTVVVIDQCVGVIYVG